LLCLVVSALNGLQWWSARRIGGFDLGIFDQGMRGYAHLGLPVSIMKIYHHEFPPGFSLLGDHFSPIVALLTPLYWVWADPRMLILGQAALFAAGVPVVHAIGRHLFESPRYADVSAVAFAIGLPLAAAAREGFHEVAFAVPLLLVLCWSGMVRNLPVLLGSALLLCATKEDLGFIVGAYGVVLLLRGWKRPGLLLLVGGPAISLLSVVWLIPAMGGEPGYYWNYTTLGADVGEAVRNVLAKPWILVQAALDDVSKPLLVLRLLGWLLFLPLGSATVLCAVPQIAERVLSTNPGHWASDHQYDAFVWPILVVAAMETAARIQAKPFARRALAAAGGIIVAFMLIASVGPLLQPAGWRPEPSGVALQEGAAMIPSGSFVEADNSIAPLLTARTRVVIVDGAPRGADYVLLKTKSKTFPFESTSQQRDRIALLLANGYKQLWTKNGVYLLQRVGNQPIPGMRVPGPGSVPVKDFVPTDLDPLYDD
jgi:uncharacterized membrane protein